MKETHGSTAPDASGVTGTRQRRLIGTIPSVFLLVVLINACAHTPQSSRSSHDHAFIRYWPPPENEGGLRLAVKDLIDMKGYVTTAGSEYLSKTNPPATRDAACLAIARERNVRIVGKTNLTEFAITVSGKNRYFGTPVNRWDGKHKAIPGGSSSGSAVAVSTGRADVAFGTDTGGSIRVPAACCGIYGLKTTYGLVSTKGVFPISPKHLDTVGPMAADIPHLVEGMDLLQRGFASRYQAAVADKPSAPLIRIGRLYINGTDPAIDKAIDEALAAKGFKVFKLDERFRKRWAQAETDGKTIALGDAWLNDDKYTHNNRNRQHHPAGDRQGRIGLCDKLQGRRQAEGGMAARSRAGLPEGRLHRHPDPSNSAALDSMVRFLHRFRMAGIQLAEHRGSEFRREPRAGGPRANAFQRQNPACHKHATRRAAT